MIDNPVRFNDAFTNLFDLKKLEIIAAANKLLKQVFAVVKKECLFGRNYSDSYRNKILLDLFGCRTGRVITTKSTQINHSLRSTNKKVHNGILFV